MNSKGHLTTSLFKSAIRMGGCIAALYFSSVIILAVTFFAAEMLGIVEELIDQR